MALDLGKQVGPLPLGAWVAVVGVGLGIAYYTRNMSGPAKVVDDTSGTPGVGEGGSGQWVQLGAPNVPTTPTIQTNEEWGVAASNYLISHGYPPVISAQAVRKYLTGVKLSPQEFTLIGEVLIKLGSPPQQIPFVEDDTPPNTTPPPDTTTPPSDGALPAPQNFRQGDSVQWTFAVRADWSPVIGAVGYVLEEVTHQAGGWETPLTVGPVTATMKFGLIHNGSYHVRIAALSATGAKGAWSPTVVFHTKN